MALRKFVDRALQADQLIRLKATGSPKEFAGKLGISERSLYGFLDELKYDFDCPIAYCHLRRSYYYTCDGQIIFRFG